MKVSRKLFGIVALGMLMLLSVSVDAMGQGRGRRVSRSDKKCASANSATSASTGESHYANACGQCQEC